MITIVDYGVGNLRAFVNLYKRLNIPTKIAQNKSDLENAQKLLLPGVGHYDFAMKQLNESGMKDTLDDLVLRKKIPVLGVCVGMQMMAKSSEEGKLEGLGWLDAVVKKIDETKINQITKLPHMGWNCVEVNQKTKLFESLEDNPEFYFLHSYYFSCNDFSNSIGTTEYGGNFTSAVNHNNIYGIQFHPEKSHRNGEVLLCNFAKI